MFDIGVGELLVILIVVVVVIGPKDLPLAMRVAGRWIGQLRRVSAHFRSGIDAMVREAELEDMEKQWKAQNEEIMRRSAALTTDANGDEARRAEANGAEAGAPVMTGPPPLEKAPFDKPATEPADTPLPPLPVVPQAPPVRPATVTLGGHAIDPEPDTPREPMLPARPHTGEDDV